MIKSKILFAAFIGTFFYTLISLIAGRNGQICYSHLKDEKIRISLQTSQIESINKETGVCHIKTFFFGRETPMDVEISEIEKI